MLKYQNIDVQIDSYTKINMIFGIYTNFYVFKEFKVLKIMEIDEKYNEIVKKNKTLSFFNIFSLKKF